MIIKKMPKILSIILILNFLFIYPSISKENTFENWLNDFKKTAIDSGISKEVVNDVMSSAKFLPKVIEYDRFQPEFYEDTFTYIKKRSSNRKVNDGLRLYKKEKNRKN